MARQQYTFRKATLLTAGLLILTFFISAGWAQSSFLYETGFEAAEGFADTGPFVYDTNPIIDDAGNWWVLEGSAGLTSVSEVTDYAEGQSLQVLPEGVVDTTRSSTVVEPEVWLQGAYRTVPQDTVPALDGMGLEPSSALMYFDTADGIMVYNGLVSDWEPIGFPVDPLGSTWYRITIRLDFGSTTWDIYVDDILQATGIGFKDSIVRYNGFRCRSGQDASGYLDNFYVGDVAPANIQLPTPSATPTPTISPTPTPLPTPQYVGAEFFLYSIHWDPEGLNETVFEVLNLQSDDSVVDWLDVYVYMKGWQQRP